MFRPTDTHGGLGRISVAGELDCMYEEEEQQYTWYRLLPRPRT